MGENFGQICTHATTSTFESLDNGVEKYLVVHFCIWFLEYVIHSQLIHRCITYKFGVNFCRKANLCDDFEEKDVNIQNN